MPLRTTVEKSKGKTGNDLTIIISGRFDFNLHEEFRNSYKEQSETINHYTIDFKDVSYLDSAALGMLLLLRKHASQDEADICIIHANPMVKEIFEMSNFGRLFEIN